MKKTVADVMSRETVELSPSDSIHEAAASLAQHGISGAPVIENGKLIGIVSEADLMRAAIPPAKVDKPRSSTMALLGLFLRGQSTQPPHDATAASIMTESVVTVSPTASIWEAASVMERHDVKRLPVIDKDGNLVGIVSRGDLVGTLARTDEELREDVLEAITLAGEESVKDVEIDIDTGKVTLRGSTDRKTTKGIALKLAARVPGIVEVVDRLEFDSDDTREIPRQKDPWATGPLVKDD